MPDFCLQASINEDLVLETVHAARWSQTNPAHRDPGLLSPFRVCQIVTPWALRRVDRTFFGQENAMTCAGMNEKIRQPAKRRSVAWQESVGTPRHRNEYLRFRASVMLYCAGA